MLVLFFSFFVLFTVYRTAENAGRNAAAWTLAGLLIFWGVEFAADFRAQAYILKGVTQKGWPVTTFSENAWVIEWLALVPSLIAVNLLAEYLDRTAAGEAVRGLKRPSANRLPNLGR